VRIVEGNQHQLVWQDYSANDLSFDLPFYDNFGDNYSILVSADGSKALKRTDKLTTIPCVAAKDSAGFYAHARAPSHLSLGTNEPHPT
jgi:hypothetical protein